MERRTQISEGVKLRFRQFEQKERLSAEEKEDILSAIESFQKSQRWHLQQTASMKKKKNRQSSKNDSCGICYENMGREMASLPCSHRFCLGCLNRWLDQSTSCPFCRSNCTHMLINGVKLNIHPVEKMETEGEDDFDPCYVCGQGDDEANLLICDSCDEKICHVYCDRGLRGRMPGLDQMWYCHYCRGEEVEQTTEQGYILDGFVVADE